MVRFEIISPSSAPNPMTVSGRLLARMREYDSYVASTSDGEVGRLMPGAGDSTHGLELRVARAAKRNRKSAETWAVDGIVYFRVTEPNPMPRRAQAQREAQTSRFQ